MIPPPPCFAIENGKVSLRETKERVWNQANKRVLSTEVVG